MEQGSASNGGQKLEVTVAGDEGSIRLDRALAVRLPELSRSRLKALIQAGQVLVDKGLVDKAATGTVPMRDPAYHVAKGDTIIIDVPEAAQPEPKGENIALPLLAEPARR